MSSEAGVENLLGYLRFRGKSQNSPQFCFVFSSSQNAIATGYILKALSADTTCTAAKADKHFTWLYIYILCYFFALGCSSMV